MNKRQTTPVSKIPHGSATARVRRLSERRERGERVEAVDDRLRRRAIEATGRVERINAEQLVDQAAGDAKHGRTAVLALNVQLVGLLALLVVAHPRRATDVTGDLVVLLRHE